MTRTINFGVNGINYGHNTGLYIGVPKINDPRVAKERRNFPVHNLQQIVDKTHIEYKIVILQVLMLSVDRV